MTFWLMLIPCRFSKLKKSSCLNQLPCQLIPWKAIERYIRVPWKQTKLMAVNFMHTSQNSEQLEQNQTWEHNDTNDVTFNKTIISFWSWGYSIDNALDVVIYLHMSKTRHNLASECAPLPYSSALIHIHPLNCSGKIRTYAASTATGNSCLEIDLESLLPSNTY